MIFRKAVDEAVGCGPFFFSFGVDNVDDLTSSTVAATSTSLEEALAEEATGTAATGDDLAPSEEAVAEDVAALGTTEGPELVPPAPAFPLAVWLEFADTAAAAVANAGG